MKIALTAAAGALASLALASAAHAAPTGWMSQHEYSNVTADDTRSDVENHCDCTGNTYPGEGPNYKIVIYRADNSTFAWDIDKTEVKYHQRDNGTWHPVSKYRCTSATNTCYSDPV